MSTNVKIEGVGTTIPREVQDQILNAVASVRYGSVEIVIHDARVVQIESREKLRVGEGLKASR